MIVVGCATNDERAFRAAGARTMQVVDEGSSVLLRHHHCRAFAAPYNEMLEVAAKRPGLEAIVLVHQDALVGGGARIAATIRELLAAHPEVAVIGAVDGGRVREVDAATGTLLALSPWAVANLRFDAALGDSLDACARDVSLQARAAGRRVLAAPLGVGRAWRAEPPADRRRQLAAMTALAHKWELPC